ncbi:signal peptidase I [Chloroflexus sp.]|uniref:signal peptidase I n=1 Tax=Chloroflexus sp. TaxID=1904827 RepID=UPI002ACDC00E|nr:signal peptidase I [Chloroflexus sp.]
MSDSHSSPDPLVPSLEAEPVRPPRAPLRYVVRELLETAIFILLVFLIVRAVVQNFKIEGSSMEPTLHTGQYILVNKLIYFHFDLNAPLRLLPGQADLPPRVVYPFRPPQRGDIVVFEYPRDVRKDYIKRVIGLPGDVLEFREGRVYVNGELLDEPYLRGAFTYCLGGYPCAQGPITVPPGSIFVMGDNRGNSSDSREWDALPLDRVVGQAWLIYFPFSDWGLVPHHRYDTVTAATP